MLHTSCLQQALNLSLLPPLARPYFRALISAGQVCATAFQIQRRSPKMAVVVGVHAARHSALPLSVRYS